MASTSTLLQHLPPEVICQIFAWSLRFDQDGQDEDAFRKPPWQLGHICESLRFIALGYPPLWNSIAISPRSSEQLRAMVETQVLRSANGPLEVYWDEWGSEEVDFPDFRCAELLLTHCTRWRSLQLRLSAGFEFGPSWLSPCAGRLDALEKLTVLGYDYTGALERIFTVAPRLREVILTDSQLGMYSDSGLVLPWGQITHYRGTYRAQQHIEILKQTSSLLECKVSLRLHLDYLPGDNLPAVLPRLRRLCIEQPRLLDRLQTPVLEELCCVRNWRLDISALLPFFHNSACSLTTLVMMTCTICPELIEVIRGLSSLTYAFIESSDERHGKTGAQYKHTSTLFSTLTISDTATDEPVCPELTSFVFGFAPEFPLDVFLSMARSRFDFKPGVMCFRLFGYDNSTFDTSSLFNIQVYSNMRHSLPLFPALESCPTSMVVPLQLLRDEGFDIAFLGRRDIKMLKAKWF
ncbi:F-box domain-containing protein [Mycena sanguinolenta]|uniref:F-box domain-containing protein n=1 Tax=Mycena sanguinolenta TaxID=230812 RepID=A0A8H7CIH6_9AGAR|nr:F-box domain-containing protein [Mycena sanguinolenta]